MKNEKYERRCPKCNKKISYIRKYELNKAEIRNSVCKKCIHTIERRKMMSGRMSGENNPLYGKHHSINTIRKMSLIKKGKPSSFQGKKHSQESLLKMRNKKLGKKLSLCARKKISKNNSKYWKGKHLSVDVKNKISSSKNGSIPWNKGKKMTNEMKKNMRIAKIKWIEENKNNGHQISPGFNKNACKLIEEYGQTHGYNFQHAMNGGEHYISELGYWVDGYDKNKNTVIEIDEKYHDRQKEKDLRRQQEIENYLKCKFIRLKI